MATDADVKQEPMTEEQPVEREVEWNAENELLSFNSNVDPGAQRYFQMFFIVTKFSELKKKDIASQEIWDHLEEMYDLESLNQQDPLYQNPEKVDFDLPAEFDELKDKKKPRRKVPN